MNIVDFLFENSYNLDKDFIRGSKGTKTFRSIYEESAKLAKYLRDNLGENQKIILLSPNSSFFIIAYLGIIKSGNICIPLNPGIEKTRYDYIAQNINSQVAFFTESIKNRIRPMIKCITESQLEEIINSNNREQLKPEPEFDDKRIAEIIFTSGSTAHPKGVKLSHKNIVSNTNSILQYLKLDDKDVMMVVLPFYYCYGLSLLHTHLRIGASIVLNNNFIFIASTIENLNKYQCTGFAGVPSHFQILLRKSELFKNTKFPYLRYVTQAGGKLPDPFIKEFLQTFPNIEFFVMYGQTEATARLSYLPPSLLSQKLGSIGKGIPGVELKVVDKKKNSIKPGEIGEIIAKGENVMLGYYEDSISTLAAIKKGWLYTGDLATVDNEGYIYITSRKKEIIKVGGIRVSPKEIEEVIVSMSGVIDCTVESVDDKDLGEAIKVTIVVNENGKSITLENLRHYCSTRLENYKIPTQLIIKDTINISSTGKKIKR